MAVSQYADSCKCGKRKHVKNVFCAHCYYTLPQKIRGPIWRYESGIDTEYPKQAVDAALDYLKGVKDGEETTRAETGT